jgi:hypothetical protein
VGVSRGEVAGVMEIDGSGRKVTGALVASADMQPALPPPFCFFCPGRPGTGSLTAMHSPQGESICAVRAHISLAVKSKQRIILRNINANRAPTHPNLASLQRAAEPAVTPPCRRPPEAAPLSHVRRPVLLIGRGPVTDLLGFYHSSIAVSECVSGLPSCSSKYAFLCVHCRPSVKLTHLSPTKNPPAVAILASDTLVHPQHVYRDVQTRCNSRDTADRGLFDVLSPRPASGLRWSRPITSLLAACVP